MATLKCKMCGGDLVVSPDSTVCECEYCGSKQTIPVVDDDKKIKLYERANKLRYNCDFDKAASVYENIIADFPDEAEAYWGLLLCKFGIEYVDSPDGRKVPTCHRSSFDCVLDDPDFEMVMENADSAACDVYRAQAKEIEAIRKGIIEVSGKEAPYDIFICYKETAEDGQRTLDSVLAQDIYDALAAKGYRVFFSRVTLEDKLGTEYEPYIFAALNSAKLMLAFGTSYQYYNAVWVKNEWSRYLKLMAQDKSKHLIPCYKNIDAYDIPKEFARLQAQDLGKVGATQDLLRGIEKILGSKKEQPAAQPAQTVIVQQSGTTTAGAQAERGFMALEDGEWAKADRFFEEALNLDPKCAEAHLGKLLLKYHKESWEALISAWKAKYADATTERLCACETDFEHIREKVQEYAVEGYLAAVEISKLYDYGGEYDSVLSCRKSQKKRQSEELRAEHHLTRAQQYAQGETAKLIANGLAELNAELDIRIAKAQAEDTTSIARVKAAYAAFITDADAKAAQMNAEAQEKQEAQYQAAVAAMNAAEDILGYKKAIDVLKAMNGFKDSDNLIAQCQKEIERLLEEARQESERKAAICAREAKRKTKRKRIIIGTVLATIVVCIAMLIVVPTAIISFEDYKAAIRLMEAGNYDEAIVAFEAMDGYKDSEEQIENCQTALKDIDYDAAVTLMDAGKYIDAIAAFDALDGYKDSAEQIENSKDLGYDEAVALMDAGEFTDAITAFEVLDGYKDSSEQIENIRNNPDYLSQNEIGDILYFGNYQGEMIAWRVLDKTDEAILLISEYALDTQPYNTKYGNVSWENCTLRTWLNNDFYDIAFDSEEQTLIQTTSVVNDDNPEHGTDGGNDTQDKLFLLSIGETETYFADDEDRICAPTAYAVNQGANTSNSTREGSEVSCWWWLRSSGFRSDDAARVSAGGLLDTRGIDASYSVGCVRPALWLNIGM